MDSVITYNGVWVTYETSVISGINYNPLDLPPYTLRLQYNLGVTPSFENGGSGVQVSSDPNIWDFTYQDPDWTMCLVGHDDLIAVLGGNTSDVTKMYHLFYWCTSLANVNVFDTSNVTAMGGMFDSCPFTSVPLFPTQSCQAFGSMFYGCTNLVTVPLFDTRNAIYFNSMFEGCTSLQSIPLFDSSNVQYFHLMFKGCTSLREVPLLDTSSCTSDIYQMFDGCTNVRSGALDMYNQVSTQSPVPSRHAYMFRNCGSNTITGAAELAQIPTSWGGTMA